MASRGSTRSGPAGGSGGEPAPSAARIEALRAACARSPGSARPRIDLARALLKANRAAEAVVPAEQAAALAPALRAAIETRQAVASALQAGDPDLTALELTAALEPLNVEAHLALGDAYAALDRPHDGERHFKAALELGRARDAHAGLGGLYLAVGMLDAAEHHSRAVLAGEDRGTADDTLIAMAHQTLAGVCAARGDPVGAARRLDQAYARQSLFPQPAAASPFTTLVLVTRAQGNIAYQSLLPPLRFGRAVWYMEHARLDQVAALPPHAVVLNAIGDADAAMASQGVVDAFVRQSARPLLNDPARVRATFRHRLGETLAGLDDVITPQTVRLSAQAIAAQGLTAAVAGAEMAPPVLVRPVGSHGGAGLDLAADRVALEKTEVPEGLDAYITAFHDTRSADGYYRKHRVIFIDRRAFPYHLAIGRHWMVHHQNTDMAGDPARVAEELAFLSDPAAAIGARAMAAVEAIGRRLDLDYAGLDFAVTGGGQVLVFEANATMLTHLEPEDGPFAAKNPFIRPIIDAFQARLAALAGTSVGRPVGDSA
jgi:tetratricopeptide (TPR) repeat protein